MKGSGIYGPVDIYGPFTPQGKDGEVLSDERTIESLESDRVALEEADYSGNVAGEEYFSLEQDLAYGIGDEKGYGGVLGAPAGAAGSYAASGIYINTEMFEEGLRWWLSLPRDYQVLSGMFGITMFFVAQQWVKEKLS
ncbi:MAG: hypothetical protein ABEK01_00970 [Candidatus Nanohaloarchaea archaeon]